jgi:hypothetical protein
MSPSRVDVLRSPSATVPSDSDELRNLADDPWGLPREAETRLRRLGMALVEAPELEAPRHRRVA